MGELAERSCIYLPSSLLPRASTPIELDQSATLRIASGVYSRWVVMPSFPTR